MPNWSGGLGGAASGYSTGSMFGGPIGGAIGAGIGGLFGLFKKKKPKQSATGPSDDAYNNIMAGYQNFANTGGMSPQDEANMRSRGIAPIRSIYSGARRDVERQSALQGGYSPNKSAALAKMAREQSMSTAESTTNLEAELANMRREGKLAGLGGMADLYRTRMSTPSDYQRKLSSIGGTMDIAGRVGESLATIFGKK